MEYLIGLVLVVLAVSTRMKLNRAEERLRSLSDALEAQKVVTAEIERQLRKLKTDQAQPAPPPTTAPVRPQTPSSVPSGTPLIKDAVPSERPSPPARPAPPTPPSPPPPRPTPAPPPAMPPVQPSRPAIAPPPPPPPPPSRPFTKPAFDWEGLIGVRLFAAIAGIAFVIGAVFFLKYSIQQGWLQPKVRVVVGVLSGIGLLVTCELKAARRYAVTANALDAAAIAILFSTFFAAHALWELIPTTPTFLLMALVTTVAVLLSIRRESLFIAVLGLLGGFLTPILLSTGQNQPIPLFSYLLLLNVGLAWVAYRKHWPVLTVLSAIFTTIYQWGWVLKFLNESSLSLAMTIFLIFPAVALGGIVLAGRRRPSGGRSTAVFERAGLLGSIGPLVFAIYLAAIPAYGSQAGLLFGFLFIVDVGLTAIAIGRREERLHAVGGAATLLVFGLWLGMSYAAAAWMVMLIAVPAFVCLYLAGSIVANKVGRPFNDVGLQTGYVAPLLLFAFAMLARTEQAATSPISLFGVMFALAAAISWRAIVDRQGGLYFVASFFLLTAEATWSAAHLVRTSLDTAVVLYAAFGLFAIGVPLVARRTGRVLEPASGSGIVLIASLALLLFLAAGNLAPAAIWGLALLLAILNAALFVESAAGRMPAIAIVGGVLSWFVLAIWWWRAAAVVGPIPALLVVVLLALVMLIGHALAHRSIHVRKPDVRGPAVGFRHALFLGLVGHFFLCFVALDPSWSGDPWPMFGALGVLTLAVSVVSGFTRAGILHAAGAAAAGMVVLVWAINNGAGTQPVIAVIAAEIVAAYSIVWIATSLRDPKMPSELAPGAGIALFLAEVTAIVAGQQTAEPAVVTLIAVHAANTAGILVFSWRYRWTFVPVLAVIPAWLGVFGFEMKHPEIALWTRLFAFAGAIYAVFAIYPFAIGRRTESRDPHIAAVLASGAFLLVARTALDRAGLSLYVGVIPVFDGAVLALLLRQLLAQDAAGSRDAGRLALVAGASLAFITVAIPLQLSHQWITIGWALEGAALAWLATRVPHRGLRMSAVALLAVVFARLVCNPAVFYYEPRGAMRIFNWYFYTYAISGVSTMVAAKWIGRTVWGEGRGVIPGLLYTAGAVMLFWLLNIEIADFYATGPEITFRFGVTVAQDLTYTIGWLVFGLAVLAAGIAAHSRTARVAAVALVAITTVKCFLYDLRSLEGLYRVGAFVGLGISLALVSVVLQKYVLTPSAPRTESIPNS